MPKLLKPGEGYAGRAPGVHPCSISLDQDAWQLLRRYCPTTKAHGHFVSRLIYEHAAKKAMVERLKMALEEMTKDE